MSDGYLDIVVFLEGKDGKKTPRTIGWGKIEGNEVKGRIDLFPARGWDGSFKIQERRERGDRLSTPRARAPTAQRPDFADAPADADVDDIPF